MTWGVWYNVFFKISVENWNKYNLKSIIKLVIGNHVSWWFFIQQKSFIKSWKGFPDLKTRYLKFVKRTIETNCNSEFVRHNHSLLFLKILNILFIRNSPCRYSHYYLVRIKKKSFINSDLQEMLETVDLRICIVRNFLKYKFSNGTLHKE